MLVEFVDQINDTSVLLEKSRTKLLKNNLNISNLKMKLPTAHANRHGHDSSLQ
jgi:hypothetical protein